MERVYGFLIFHCGDHAIATAQKFLCDGAAQVSIGTGDEDVFHLVKLGLLDSEMETRRRLGLECDPDWIRTNDPQLRRLVLYPTELPDQDNFRF